ncbi:cation diffusion facilitator family transporter [Methylocystis echinoides]|uniref:Cation efflux system protein n=1 Tax=Methylocystis echinoides TaxID=29468 RepID=A0A9W6GWS4_9HYPH|nr:cation diffusion facilitator family transporter [Methylocystis echinoides]GLI94366.1 cation efflux system protein [Methylocystis echinoides]
MTETRTFDVEGGNRKLAAARASIAASALLAVAKLAAGVWSGSLALLSEAGHAFVDTGATVITFYALREAQKPADAEHHYGHGKYEALAALVETGLLFGLAIIVVGEAIRRLGEGHSVEIDAGWPAYGVLIGSICVDFVRSRQLSVIAREERSDALAADAIHFASDLVSSVLALAGVAAAHYGFPQGDALASFGVAAFIAIAGYRLGRRTIDTLLDAAPRELAPQIEQAILDVPGVMTLDSLRLRSAGAEVIGEATVGVARTLRVEQAARIKEAVSSAILAAAPHARVTITADPLALDDETMVERIMLVAARRHIIAHHVLAQQIGERLAIGLDIELDGAMPMGRAHAIATDFESAIRDEFGADVEIETHIEPLAPHVLIGRDAPEEMSGEIAAALDRYSELVGYIANIHDVRVRETAGGLVVNYHCAVDAAVPVETMHAAVDELERRFRADYPEILRIVGHAEPEDH